MSERAGIEPPPRIFHLLVEGYCEIWETELRPQQDPVDAVKEALEPLSFDGVVRLVRT